MIIHRTIANRIAMIDVLKCFFAILVVSMHSFNFDAAYFQNRNLFYIGAFARLAVPFFFCASSFLFFEKIRIISSIDKLKQSEIRMMTKYLFFGALLFLKFFVQYSKNNFDIPEAVVNSFHSVITSYLWYIVTLMIWMCFLFYAKRKTIILFCFILSLLCWGGYYWGMILGIDLIKNLFSSDYFSVLFTRPFLFGACYCSLGAILSIYKEKLLKLRKIHVISILVVLISIHYCEMINIAERADGTYSLFTISLPFIVLFIMVYSIKSCLKSNEITSYLGKSSSVIYFCHYFFIFLSSIVIKNYFTYPISAYILWCTSIVLCFLLTWCVSKTHCSVIKQIFF